jgi:hypothetical protein
LPEKFHAMTGHHFILTDFATGAVVAHAVLCPEVRYAGVRTMHSSHHVTHRSVIEWLDIEEELRVGWVAGVVGGESATARALIPRTERWSVGARKMTEVVGVEPGSDAGVAFDRYLMMQGF